MNFDDLKNNQKEVIRLLENTVEKERLVHTYLFEGVKGTPKIEAAYYLAMLILCEELTDKKPCLKCRQCVNAMAENNINIYVVRPDKETIKKEQIRDLEYEFAHSALEGGKRVFIIEDIDKATLEAANSLLKFLEESNDSNYGILITDNIQKVLLTIKSRSQVISFREVPRATLINELEKEGIPREDATIYASITNDLKEALEYHTDSKVKQIIELVKEIGRVLILRSRSATVVLFKNGVFLLKEQLKKYHYIFVDLLIVHLNDQLLSLSDQKDKMIFYEDISKIDNYIINDIAKTSRLIEKLFEFRNRLNYNVNIELMYCQMLEEIAR
ncbi:MAG: hypothetical protein ACOX4W_02470 [Bacilli bacterium]|jgi:DNA polymerase-3 subunit delta'